MLEEQIRGAVVTNKFFLKLKTIYVPENFHHLNFLLFAERSINVSQLTKQGIQFFEKLGTSTFWKHREV